MKSIIVKVQIQLDQLVEKNSEQYVMETLESMNEVLRNKFVDISPTIFCNNIDSSDIEISEF